MAGIEELLVTIASKFDDAGFKALDRSTSKASKATSVLSNSLRGLFVGIIGTIGAREIVNATVKLDSLTTSMNALAGSQEAGAAQMKFLRQETNRLGQDFMTTADAYKNLFSSGKGAGMADSDIQSIFSGVLEAGTVLGSSQQQIQGAITAIEQMISKGKVSTQELRLQLGNALPGAMQIAARAMGVTNQEFQAMLESGLDSQKFVIAFANQLHTEFSGKAAEASHTLRAELARLQNSFNALKASFLDGEGTQELANALNEVANLLKSNEMKTSMDAIAKFIAFALKHIKEIGAIVAIILGNKMLTSAAKGILGAGSGIARGLQTALNLKSLTAGMAFLPRIWEVIRLVFWALNPLSKITLILTAILAISALVGKLWKDKVKKDQEEAKKTQPDIIRLPDGRYVDRNPNSPTFGKIGQGYSQEDIAQLLFNNNKGMPSFNFKQQSEGFNDWLNPTRPEKLLWKAGAIQRNENSIHIGALNITAKTDDPKDFGAVFKFELTKFFDGFSQGSGFTSPRIRF